MIIFHISFLAPIAEAVQDVESSSVMTTEGGLVSVQGVKLLCPPGAVDDPVTVKLVLEEPYKYCGLILNHGPWQTTCYHKTLCGQSGRSSLNHKTSLVTLKKWQTIGDHVPKILSSVYKFLSFLILVLKCKQDSMNQSEREKKYLRLRMK